MRKQAEGASHRVPISRQEVLHIAALCRIGVTEDDLESLQEKLSQVLDLFRGLDEVDTSDTPPSDHSGSLESVMRSDEAADSAPREAMLANAPSIENELIRVMAVLEG